MKHFPKKDLNLPIFKDEDTHEIFVSGHRVTCTCSYSALTESYAEARKLAEKHAEKSPKFLIKPLTSI